MGVSGFSEVASGFTLKLAIPDVIDSMACPKGLAVLLPYLPLFPLDILLSKSTNLFSILV